MGPYQRTPKKVTRAIKYPGLGVRSVGPVGDFLDQCICQVSVQLQCWNFRYLHHHTESWVVRDWSCAWWEPCRSCDQSDASLDKHDCWERGALPPRHPKDTQRDAVNGHDIDPCDNGKPCGIKNSYMAILRTTQMIVTKKQQNINKHQLHPQPLVMLFLFATRAPFNGIVVLVPPALCVMSVILGWCGQGPGS